MSSLNLHTISQSLPARPGFRHVAESTFNLPLSANVLFLTFTGVSGPTMSSSLDIVTSPSQPHDLATVRVAAYYDRQDIYNACKVSMIHRAGGEYGVDVFVSDWVRKQHHHDDKIELRFEMRATFPELSASPLVIKKFETDAHNTVQKVGDFKDKVLFQSFYLKGTSGSVHVVSLKANHGRIETSNGGIHGHFNVSGELTLSTTNGPIEVDVGLTSTAGSKAKVAMGSANGDIQSGINLSSSSGSGGSFEAFGTTTNGLLDIKFPTAPVDSYLTFTGKTTNGKATISLNPAYEGTFKLQSAESTPTVDEHKAQDPSGKKRKRVVSVCREGRHRKIATGQVYWGEPKTRGTVDVQTKNGKLVLTLAGDPESAEGCTSHTLESDTRIHDRDNTNNDFYVETFTSPGQGVAMQHFGGNVRRLDGNLHVYGDVAVDAGLGRNQGPRHGSHARPEDWGEDKSDLDEDKSDLDEDRSDLGEDNSD